jgi:excinuclease ABC subunit B
LGSPEEYEKVNLKLEKGMDMTRAILMRRLIDIYFERVAGDLSPGTYRAIGNNVEIMPASERALYRVVLGAKGIERIVEIDPLTREIREEHDTIFIFPAKHYVTPEAVQKAALADIEAELALQLKKFDAEGKLLEADRLKRRTRQDITLIKEFGFCNGIENYSKHFDRRAVGEPPYTLLSYFPHKKDGTPDFLTVIDESHVTVSQIGGMYAGDRSRKQTLIEHGFRLPSALDNRPLTFAEFDVRRGQTLYTSATPGKYEIEHSGAPIQQVIRPTGLVDPEIIMRPVIASQMNDFVSRSSASAGSDERLTKSFIGAGVYPGQVKDFIAEAEATTKRGMRSLVTVLTKKMAEDLSAFLIEKGIKARYVHSDIKTVERIEILTDFRKGVFDVLVGVNLLREGLDLPEVELVGILDADKEGFLRSETSLIQTMGRAARNLAGRVIVYADTMTGSLERAIGETNRRREIQLAHNKKHNISPQSIKKRIHDIVGDIQKARSKAIKELASLDASAAGGDLKKRITALRKQMHDAADALDFETATLLRDEIRELEKQKIEQEKKAKGKKLKPGHTAIE